MEKMEHDGEKKQEAEEAKDDEIVPREYQSILMEKCKKSNTILYLPTGTGKTYIAVMLIKHLSRDLEDDFEKYGKRTFFMVNTVALVEQQANYIRRHTPLTVGHYSGDMNVDYWSREKWLTQLQRNKVFVMTAQIFRDILLHCYISPRNVNLIIFDECHQGVSDHVMAQIMELFGTYPVEQLPLVLGMTATILNSDCKLENVELELNNLEKTFRSKATTVDPSMYKEHSTNPDELLYTYDQATPIPVMEEVRKHIGHAQSWLMDVMLKEDIVEPSPSPFARRLGDDLKINKKLRNIMADVWYHVDDLGLFGGNIAAIKHIIQLERLREKADDTKTKLVFLSMITTLNLVSKLMEDEMAPYDKKLRIYKYSTPKVLKLLEYLKGLKPQEGGTHPRGIIFVDRRFSAKVVCMILKYLKIHDENFEFLAPDFMVGFQNNPFNTTREGFLDKKWNGNALARFTSGKSNIIVSSNVLEEGIDIPQCNIVVRFDPIKSYRSYIQTKGRARHKPSMFIILVSKKDAGKFSVKYKCYQDMEARLTEILNKRESGEERRVHNGPELDMTRMYSVKTANGTSKVTLNSAISLVNRYCSMLPQDQFTSLTPSYFVEDVVGTDLIQCILLLPINSPVKDEIRGEPMPSQRLAKQAVALKTCEMLHKAGELDDNLLPQVLETANFEDPKLFIHWQDEEIGKNQPRPGTKKRKRSHPKKLPSCLCQCAPMADTPVYLHMLQIKAAYERPEDNDSRRMAFYKLIEASEGFAICSSKKLPEICDFRMFLNVGPLDVSLKSNYLEMVLTSEEIKALRQFNTMIFFNLLRLCKSFMTVDLENKENSFFIVPTKTDSSGHHCIDWDVVNTHSTIPDVEPPGTDIKVTEEDYLLSVVAPWYRISSDQMYVVTKVCFDMTPNSPFPTSEFSSFAEYYKSRYRLTVKNLDQPLIEVKAISNKINCLRPRSSTMNPVTSKRKRQEMQDDFEEHFIPELCFRFEFPSTLWLKSTCLPSLLHRVAHLLLAEELRVKIAQKVGFTLQRGVKWDLLKEEESFLEDEERKLDGQGSLVNNALSKTAPITGGMENFSLLPWKSEDEPIDIDRELLEEITLMDVLYFESFASKPLDSKFMESELISSNGEDSTSPMSSDNVFSRRAKKKIDCPIKILDGTAEGIGPQQYEVLQALTTAATADIINMERLETLGDSFLKFSISFFLFFTYPKVDEGILTQIKGKIVGNRNLYYCGQAHGLPEIMKVHEFSARNDWTPPGFCVPRWLQQVLRETNLCPSQLYDLRFSTEEKLRGELDTITYNKVEEQVLDWTRDNVLVSLADAFIGQQTVSDKTVADCVEALIGAYLKGYGVEGAAKMLGWFDIIPSDVADVFELLKMPATTALLVTSNRNSLDGVEFHLTDAEASEVEMVLGYRFRDRSFLLQALTHASYIQNRITDCYQRLEFIGDAILDFLITCHIYESCGKLTPGELTDLRSALVNNITFGCLTVRYGFHRYCKYESIKLFEKIDTFVRYQDTQNHKVTENVLILVEEDDCHMAESVDVPKVLGDLFESLAGAIFLDSGNSLKEVWKVFSQLMGEELVEFKESVPKHPVRLLHERCNSVQFLKTHVISDTAVMVQVEIMERDERKIYSGFGENKMSASRAAAKLALKDLKSNR